MQIVLKDGYVIATHDDTQAVAGFYPGCECVIVNRVCNPGDADPRTDEEKSQAYQDKRRAAYPSVAEQLDMLYHDQVDGTTKWRDLITSIKQTYQPAPADPAVCQAKADKLALLAEWRAAKLAEGYNTGFGFCIKIGETDQHTFAAYKLLLDSAVAAGTKTADSTVVIADVDGEPRSITVDRFFQLTLPYGGYCEAFFQQYQTALSLILSAVSVDGVNAVVIPA